MVALPIMYAVAAYRVKMQTASVYHHVKCGGKGIGFVEFIRLFSLNQEVLSLTSDEGNLLIVHGNKLTHGFVDHGFQIGQASLYAKHHLVGTYNLISCYNGFHTDVTGAQYCIRRDRNTLNEFPALIMPFFGNIITWSSPITRKYVLACLAVAGITVDKNMI